MTTKIMPQCIVCLEPTNKSSRKEVTCISCKYTACCACSVQYILGLNTLPSCMNCRVIWDDTFIYSNFTKTFVNGQLREHYSDILFEREKGLMPATQPDCERYLKCLEIQKTIHALNVNYKIESKAIYELSIDDYSNNLDILEELYNHKKTMEIIKVEIEYNSVKRCIIMNKKNNERVVCVRCCPVDNCRGFLSTAWKCGLCDVKVCATCHEIKDEEGEEGVEGEGVEGAGVEGEGVEGGGVEGEGVEGEGVEGVEGEGVERDAALAVVVRRHVCNPDNVETAKLLSRDSKLCPKCGCIIFKIEGCDQMFCTQCHTAFSWNTRKIENGRIHNPHYYEWLRQQNHDGEPIRREIGDDGCGGGGGGGGGGLRRINILIHGLSRFNRCVVLNVLSDIHRIIQHITHVTIHRYRVDNLAENREIRIKYMTQLIDERQFKYELYRADKKLRKKTEIRLILEMFIQTSSDIINRLAGIGINEGLEKLEEIAKELESLRLYTNSSMRNILKLYGFKTDLIYWKNTSVDYFKSIGYTVI
jgi:hypothetical protein